MLLIYYQRIDLKSIETLKNHKINSNCYSMDIDNTLSITILFNSKGLI